MAFQLGLLGDDRPTAFAPDEPDLVIRPSRRAKRLILRVVPPFQIELVVPRGTRPGDVEAFVCSSREWIRRAQAELAALYPAERRALPERIDLEAIQASWAVDVEAAERSDATLRVSSQHLLLRVPRNRPAEGYEPLRQWLLGQGRRHLRPWLMAEAERIGVSPKRVQIRTQRTRWGSCSEHGNISLNAAVLLLRPALVRYLLVHELCHLQHLDHSRAYWRLVEQHDPHYRAHDAALAAAWSEVPAWALPR